MAWRKLNQKVVPLVKVSIEKSERHLSVAHVLIFIILFAGIGSYLLFRSFAATITVASIEAEQMSLPIGAHVYNDSSASAGQAVVFEAPGTATGTVNIPAYDSATGITVTARATQCNGWPHLSVAIDSSTVLPATEIADSGWTTFSAALNLSTGSHSLSLITGDHVGQAYGNCHRDLYVDVISFSGPPATPPPTVAFSATPTTLSSGNSTTLTWNSTNSISCIASGDWSGTKSTSGSLNTGALSSDQTYSLSCSGTGGTANSSANVTVTPPSVAVYTYITGANATGCSTCAQNPAHTVSEIENSVNAPLVAGFSWVIPWSDIETGPNQYNWAEIDNAIAASAGHKVMLRVIAGEDSPAWVTSSVPSVNATFPLAGGGSQSKTIPILWDSGYLTDWTQFIAAYGSRYANNPNVTVVQMPGGGRIGESSIGDWAGWLSNSPTPNGAGSEPYTDARMLTAWEQIVNAYATAFPSTSSVQLAIDDDGPSLIANGTTYTVQPALASYITSTVASTYHVHPWFQANDLGHNGSGAVNFLTNLETVTKIGWQEWLGNQLPPFETNAASTAITTNATYVEWYLSDILNTGTSPNAALVLLAK